MPWFDFIWDEAENLAHLAEHDLTPEDVEDVVRYADNRSISRTTGRQIAFGFTPSGRHVCVVYDKIEVMTVYVVTAYDVD